MKENKIWLFYFAMLKSHFARLFYNGINDREILEEYEVSFKEGNCIAWELLWASLVSSWKESLKRTSLFNSMLKSLFGLNKVFPVIMCAIFPTTVLADIKIIDADTIQLGGQKIRLAGIDAPERLQKCETMDGSKYDCGLQATQALRDLVNNIPAEIVKCEYTDEDKYGRLIGECKIGNININGWLVENGWALAYRDFSVDYVANEQLAEQNKVGIWKGRFVAPWEWRKGERLNLKVSITKDDCSIKGNISSSGEKIYHVQGGHYYARTKVSLKNGEKWFCSEEEAVKNGWRKSMR